ncbi:MAG: ABC transporter permease [Lachnospiraceae bacterium]|nr:ABC transporter permease [Lachnospiraceae bacterium]
MRTLFAHEMRMNRKSLLIWMLCVAGIGFSCILLFTSLEDSMKGMEEAYSSMGAFSQAFGLDRLSIATLEGYYATEIGVIHGLGSAMFAAIIGTVLLSKEEDGHTSEFLYTLPISRRKAVFAKWTALMTNILIFNVICALSYLIGFLIMGESMDIKCFVLFHLAQTIMNLEIGSICFLISACTKKNKIGAGLGIVILLYAVDMMARIVPAIKDLKYITPFYYANAADIFCNGKINSTNLIIGIVIFAFTTIAAFLVYEKKDLAA